MHLIHRGLVGRKYKENTIQSFKASFKKGYGIETDIQVTRDNQFVCFHDYTLNRIHNNVKSIKKLNYCEIDKIAKNRIPLLKDLLKLSKNKYYLFLEIKPLLSHFLIKKLIKETKLFKKCVFISFKEENIYKILKFNNKVKVGLSFSPATSIKVIKKKSQNKHIDCLILDKFFLQKDKVQKLKKEKYFYTIRKKTEFKKYSNNNLIFENL